MKRRQIVDHCYFRDVVLILGSDAELEGWCLRRNPEFGWDNASGKYVQFAGDRTQYILVSTRTRGRWRLAVLGHEVLHLTFAVLTDAGIQMCEGSEEAFTYYFQAMFAKCLSHI